MMAKLIRHLLTLSVSFFDKQSHSDIVQTVRIDVTQLRVMVSALGSIMRRSVCWRVGYLVAAVMISSKVALVALVVVPHRVDADLPHFAANPAGVLQAAPAPGFSCPTS